MQLLTFLTTNGGQTEAEGAHGVGWGTHGLPEQGCPLEAAKEPAGAPRAGGTGLGTLAACLPSGLGFSPDHLTSPDQPQGQSRADRAFLHPPRAGCNTKPGGGGGAQGERPGKWGAGFLGPQLLCGPSVQQESHSSAGHLSPLTLSAGGSMASAGTGDEGMKSIVAGHWAEQGKASPYYILPPLPEHPRLWAAGTLAGRLRVTSKLWRGAQVSPVVLKVTPILQWAPTLSPWPSVPARTSRMLPRPPCWQTTPRLAHRPPRTTGCPLTDLSPQAQHRGSWGHSKCQKTNPASYTQARSA